MPESNAKPGNAAHGARRRGSREGGPGPVVPTLLDQHPGRDLVERGPAGDGARTCSSRSQARARTSSEAVRSTP